MNRLTKIYFDSSVWLSHILGDKRQIQAENQLRRIENEDSIGVVSHLVVLEILEVIRKRITEKERYTGLSDSAKATIKNKIDTKVREFIEKITRLENQGKIVITDSNKKYEDFLSETVKTFSPYFGDIEDCNYCFFCRQNITVRYRYRGLGHYDVQHSLLALDNSADEMVSGDESFRHLNGINKFSSIKVTII